MAYDKSLIVIFQLNVRLLWKNYRDAFAIHSLAMSKYRIIIVPDTN